MSAKKTLYILLGIIATLLLLNILSFWNLHTNGLEEDTFFFKKFNFDTEKNVPSIFSSVLLFSAAVLLFKIAMTRLTFISKKYFWYSLSIVFLFLALDELLRIHEKIGKLFPVSENTPDVFHYAWVIPYGIVTLCIGILYIKPLLKLPKQTLLLFILAGCIFISGAIGLEMIAGWSISQATETLISVRTTPQFFILYTIEELLEMLGVTLFIYQLIRVLEAYTHSDAQ